MGGIRVPCIAVLVLLAAGGGAAEAATTTYAGSGSRIVGSGGTGEPGQAVKNPFLVRSNGRTVDVVVQVTADCKVSIAGGARVDYARAVTVEFANVRIRRGGRFSTSRFRQRSTGGSPLSGAKVSGTFGRDLRGRRSRTKVSGLMQWSLADPKTRAACETIDDGWEAKKVRRFDQRATQLTVSCTGGSTQVGQPDVTGRLLVGGAPTPRRVIAVEFAGPPFADGTPNYPDVVYRQTEADGTFVGNSFLPNPGPHKGVAMFAGASDARPAEASCSFTNPPRT